jgi:hypothetical protein
VDPLKSTAEDKAAHLLKKLEHCKNSLWYLATQVLGYDRLSREYHKPMLDEWDERRQLRMAGKYRKHELEMWPRGYYKTTCRQAQIVQNLLWDPDSSCTWWHAVDEKASEAIAEVGHQLQGNKVLREIMGSNAVPSASRDKKFVTAKGFDMPRGAKSRRKRDMKTCRPVGAGSESTGGHSDIGFVDDIIGQNDIEDNLMPKKRRWFGQTVKNVVNYPDPKNRFLSGVLFGTGTHWDANDIYTDWQKRKTWDCRVRGAYETDGVIDWKGEPMLFSKRVIEDKRQDMSEFAFGCQMMNDPSIRSEKLWQTEFEEDLFVKPSYYQGFRSVNFVLSDPAPAKVGSFGEHGEKDRADGTKDAWATCVVKVMMMNDMLRFVLVDGEASKDWDKDAGFSKCMELSRRWGSTPYVASESTGLAIALYSEEIRKAAQTAGVRVYYNSKKGTWGLPLSWTYRGKNNYFEALVSLAMRGQLKISESCPKDYVDEVLNQVRMWRCMPNGRNALKHDDEANCFSFITDPALKDFFPKVSEYSDTVAGWNPYRSNQEEETEYGFATRYIRA